MENSQVPHWVNGADFLWTCTRLEIGSAYVPNFRRQVLIQCTQSCIMLGGPYLQARMLEFPVMDNLMFSIRSKNAPPRKFHNIICSVVVPNLVSNNLF